MIEYLRRSPLGTRTVRCEPAVNGGSGAPQFPQSLWPS
jgi:hypothetical protein